MIRRLRPYLLLIILGTGAASAQEVVTGLHSNPVVARTYKTSVSRASAIPDTLTLPFFDDFSGHSVLPYTGRWADNDVFINNTYSDKQITAGIATFDALDKTGRLYTTANTTGFSADKLTSLPIDLRYSAADNVYLSFFYQPGGLSDSPEPADSLTLQFLSPSENKWYSVWKKEGSSDTSFKAAIIKIDNNRFLKKGFRFRFINYASLSPNLSDPSMIGNCDIWNIDYVMLNRNRTAADTVFADVAYTLPLRSLLKTHEAMPLKQFNEIFLQEMRSEIPVHYRNNDIKTRNVTRDFRIQDVYRNTEVYSYSAGATNIAPLTTVDYNASLVYTFSSPSKDSALFRVTASLKTDSFDPKSNDTLVYYQVFKNYFSFDDGSSEGGYGINGLGSRNAMVACRFESFVKDTLRAVKICFNDSYQESNKREFDLMIWANDNGIPGSVLYTVQELMVEQGTSINGFYTYTLPEGVVVNGPFFVGWKQRSETFLNAGFDINTPHEGRQYYYLNGEWSKSQMNGSLMIRPVLGSPLLVTSVDDITVPEKNKTAFWPNPAKDYINLSTSDSRLPGKAQITISDMTGRKVLNAIYNERIDISDLHEGMYLIVVTLNGLPVGYNKLIKAR